MNFFSGQTFTGRLKMTAAALWLAAAVVAGVWFGLPAAWKAIPPKSLKPIQKSFAQITKSIQPTLDKAGTPAKVIGGLILVLAPVYTGGLAYFLLNTKRWQAAGNDRLAQAGVVNWLSVPATDKNRWERATDMWLRVRTPLMRPDWDILRGRGVHASFEVIAVEADGIYWLLWSPDPRELEGKDQAAQDLPGTLGAALAGYNPKIRVVRTDDPVAKALDGEQVQVQWFEVGLSGPSHYPIKTAFEGDPMMAVVSNMSTDQNARVVGMQVLVRPAGDWKAPGQQELTKLTQAQAETSAKLLSKAEKERKLTIEAKLDQFGYETVIRFYAAGSDPQSLSYRLRSIQDTLGQYQELNALTVTRRGQDAATVTGRGFPPRLDPVSVLNVGEINTLYHLPSEKWEPIPGIKWAPARIIPPTAIVIRGWGLPQHLQEAEQRS